jgi:predicted DNA-binding protein (MmcQ/YjbR family)
VTAARGDAELKRFALSLPGAWEDSPWGDRVSKVGRKIFAWLPSAAATRLGVKLVVSHDEALAAPGAALMGYGLGRAGWVTVPVDGPGAPDTDLLCDWIEESYRQVALKRLVRELDARDPAGPDAPGR